MSLSKVEIRRGLSSYYENFARNNLVGRYSEIKNMNTQQYINFIQDIVVLGNATMSCMSCYARENTGIDIGFKSFELELHTKQIGDTLWYEISTSFEVRSTILKFPFKIDVFNADKFTLSLCLCSFIEIAISNYFNTLCEVIDESL